MRKYIRTNRPSAEIAEDERRVLFRMSARHYEALKQVAKGKKKPVTVIINEALEKQYKLSSIAKPFPAISTRKTKK
jgi:basic membrane lipoprotein Med (substrate-binding protein (PBP1-ABC) superfamily)